MNQVTKFGLKKMVIDAFEAYYNEYKHIDKFGNPIDSYVKLITAHDDFSDMLRKCNVFIGYILGYMCANKSFNHEDNVKKFLLESNKVTLLIYAFGDDKDAIFALKGKGIEIKNLYIHLYACICLIIFIVNPSKRKNKNVSSRKSLQGFRQSFFRKVYERKSRL
jgi:hypothetical protein